ncbi:MAG: quinone-dependent dihydroorotate dehydrogenase [Acidobacteriota bacterium]|nr:quinone-dependent dihydroorotate dehydrogenase [Acidobacteriota bacterium]
MLYRTLLRPALFRLEPERAHEFALHALELGLGTEAARNFFARRFAREPFGELRRFGLTFKNPVGVAAGFDKNGRVARQLCALGFGFVEAGTVTNLAQPGNARPRLFRLPEDRALINRQGFNNEGASALAARLAREGRPRCVLGVNIGKSRAVDVTDAIPDYLASFDAVRAHADYVAVNVSSPNTPGLRELQRADALASLLGAIQQRNREAAGGDPDATESAAARREKVVPLLVKIAPDLGEGELELIVDVARRAGVGGIIATNTTTSRDNLRTHASEIAACGEGGLSGAPLRERATKMIANLYRLARGGLTIVGVGGIFTARDAWEKICAGASLVELYTGFVYQGFAVARDINDGLRLILEREGFKSLDDAVGCRAEEIASRP